MQKYALLYGQRRGLNSALPQTKVEMTPQHIYILSVTPLLEGSWWGSVILLLVGRVGIEPTELESTWFTVKSATFYGIPTHIKSGAFIWIGLSTTFIACTNFSLGRSKPKNSASPFFVTEVSILTALPHWTFGSPGGIWTTHSAVHHCILNH